MTAIRIRLDLDREAYDSPLGFSLAFVSILSALVRWNQALIRKGHLSSLYTSGVRYQEEETESFATGLTVLRRGWGDCAHLCAWRIAELRERGEHARFRMKWGRGSRGPRKEKRFYHVLVRRGNGKIECPSRLLGMGQE